MFWQWKPSTGAAGWRPWKAESSFTRNHPNPCWHSGGTPFSVMETICWCRGCWSVLNDLEGSTIHPTWRTRESPASCGLRKCRRWRMVRPATGGAGCSTSAGDFPAISKRPFRAPVGGGPGDAAGLPGADSYRSGRGLPQNRRLPPAGHLRLARGGDAVPVYRGGWSADGPAPAHLSSFALCIHLVVRTDQRLARLSDPGGGYGQRVPGGAGPGPPGTARYRPWLWPRR